MAAPETTNSVTVRKLTSLMIQLWTKIKNALQGKQDDLGISSSGDAGKFLNEKGEWAEPAGTEQVNSDWNATSGKGQILNKPNLATVATSGSYADLSGKPTIPAAANNSTITINGNGTKIDSFTVNASSNKTINITPSNIGAAAASHTHAASAITSGTFADARIASAAKWNRNSGYTVNPTQSSGTLPYNILFTTPAARTINVTQLVQDQVYHLYAKNGGAYAFNIYNNSGSILSFWSSVDASWEKNKSYRITWGSTRNVHYMLLYSDTNLFCICAY